MKKKALSISLAILASEVRVRKSGSGYFVDTDAYVPYGLEKRSRAPQ